MKQGDANLIHAYGTQVDNELPHVRLHNIRPSVNKASQPRTAKVAWRAPEGGIAGGNGAGLRPEIRGFVGL